MSEETMSSEESEWIYPYWVKLCLSEEHKEHSYFIYYQFYLLNMYVYQVAQPCDIVGMDLVWNNQQKTVSSIYLCDGRLLYKVLWGFPLRTEITEEVTTGIIKKTCL